VNRKARRAQERRETAGRVGPERIQAIAQLTRVSGISLAATAVAVRLVALRLEVSETVIARSLYDRIVTGKALREAVVDEAIARRSALAGKPRAEVHEWLFKPYIPKSA
jgi:hypothetical protein